MDSTVLDKENQPPACQAPNPAKAGPVKERVRITNKHEKYNLVMAAKGCWTPEDDQKLQALVYGFGTKNWNEIGSHFPHKSGRQCHERWNVLFNDPAYFQAIKLEFASTTHCEQEVTPQRVAAKAVPHQTLASKTVAPKAVQLAVLPKRHSSASPLVQKVNKLHDIAKKLQCRQGITSITGNDMSPGQGQALTAVPVALKRKLEHWSSMYGVDVDQMEYVTFVRRPPAPPIGFRPRRIVRQAKAPEPARQPCDTVETDDDEPDVDLAGLEARLLGLVEWRYSPPPSLQTQLTAINKLVRYN
ncbi:hypothetical protein ACHHYP_15835 [Achlya hypogyna]|uniref:Uncharacterized protein n=1 Tax=Achlya hypogyna TaxID=1202772 RepID=A0A1V9ZF07_ACHHY|nr:hypothetical protein ACHHYP_15835 [Achlya hypogyna]